MGNGETNNVGIEMPSSDNDAFFGVGEPADQTTTTQDDPGKTQTKTGDEKSTGDPSSETTSKTDGSEGDKSQTSQQPPKLAGKYETAEALEQGYNQLFTQSQTVQAENKAYRDKIAELEAKITAATAGKTGATAATDKTEQAPKDFASNPAVKEALESLEPVIGPDGIKSVLKLFEAIPQPQPASNPEIEAELAELRAERLEERFIAKRPEAADELIIEMRRTIADEATQKTNEVEFWQNLFCDAAIGRLAPHFIDRGVLNKLKKMSKQERDKLLAGNLGEGEGAGGQAGTGESDTPMRAAQKEAFGEYA